MAKDIKLRVGNEKPVLSDVKYLETYTDDGEKCLWVCEDDIRLGTFIGRVAGIYRPSAPLTGYKSAEVDYIVSDATPALGVLEVTENGIYKASTDSDGPFLGYSKVMVNVNRGGIYPDYIEIRNYPKKMVYRPYELFEYDGLQVAAYQNDHLVWNKEGYFNGEIPLDEITLYVNYAGRYAEYGGMTFRYELGIDNIIYIDESTGEALYTLTAISGVGPFYIAEIYGYNDEEDEIEYISRMAIMSRYNFSVQLHDHLNETNETDSAIYDDSMGSDVYVYSIDTSQTLHPGHCSAPRNYAEGNLGNSLYEWNYAAYTILYGEKSLVRDNTVDVRWASLGVSHVYTTSFEFSVES